MNILIILWMVLILGVSAMHLLTMKEKDLYEVTYRELLREYTTIIEAKDRCQAVKKIHKMCTSYCPPEIISIRRV